MVKVKGAVIFTIISQQMIQIIGLVSVVVLARLLTPAEVGVYAIASSIALLAIELRSLGVGQFLVREETLDDEKIRLSIGVMITISWALGALVAIAAPFVDDFYNEPALSTLLWIISLTFLLSPFASVPFALLSRELKFQEIFYIKVGSAATIAAVSIGLVLAGLSYYGLAIGLLMGSIAEFLIIQYYAPKGIPWKPKFKGMGKLMQFGMLISTAQMFNRFSESLPDLVIGRAGTMTDVGLFSRGLGLILFIEKFIVHAAGPVVLPFLSAINRAGQSVSEAYMKVISLQSAISLPVLAVVHVAAYPVIKIMFGDQWDAAIPVASVLAFWAMLQSIHSFSDTALISLGREKLMFNCSLIIFLARIGLVLFAAFSGETFSLLAVAWALVASGIVEILVKSYAIHEGIGAAYWPLYKRLIPSFVVTILCWAGIEAIDYYVDLNTEDPWISMAYIATLMPIIWIASIKITNHELWDTIMEMIGRKPATQSDHSDTPAN